MDKQPTRLHTFRLARAARAGVLNPSGAHVLPDIKTYFHLEPNTMSLALTNTSQFSTSSVTCKDYIFSDLPLISKQVKLNIIELDKSDKQVANELVYRFCRILTRPKINEIVADHNICRVFIIDTIASMNPIRLAAVLKRDSTRLRQIRIARQCKINSTYATLCANFKLDDKPIVVTPKLCVIYHDEFYIQKTLNLLKDVMNKSPRTQFVLVLPKLDRLSRDALNLMPANQILKCDFAVDRKNIAPAPVDSQSDSYQKYLNHVMIKRHSKASGRFETLEGELREDALFMHKSTADRPKQVIIKVSQDVKEEFNQPYKKHKTSQDDT